MIAKNYLREEETCRLDRLVAQFLDFAEDQAERRIATTMEQWVAATDRLLAAGSLHLLSDAGAVAHESIETVVDERWPGFAEARRRRESEESWQVETADIAELLEIEKSRKVGGV